MESEMNRLLSLYRSVTDDHVISCARRAGVGRGAATRRTLAALIGCIALLAVAPVAAQAATASISGTVTSAKSGGTVGLPGISVTATSELGSSSFTTTAANGTYTISGLAGGEYTVEFSDASQAYLTQDKTATLTEGNNTQVNAELKASSIISGVVTSATNGNGLGGVDVQLFELGGLEEREAITSPNGEYTVTNLPPGDYEISFFAESGSYISQTTSTILGEGEVKDVSAALVEGGKVTGRVIDSVNHNGLGKIGVFVYGSGGDGEASTNSNGEYTVTGLSSGSYNVVFSWEYSEAELKACEKAPRCPPKYITQYFNDQPSAATANKVGVIAGSTTSGINVTMVPAAPVNTAAPVVSGTPTVGSLLSCSNGSWTGENELTLSVGWPFTTPFAYQWLRDGSAIAGSTSNAYLVQAADLGHGLVCEVTATNAAGHASAKSNSLAIPLPVPVITVSSAKLTVSGGAARVPIACAAAATCTGTVELTQQVTVKGHGKGKKKTKAKKKTVVLGKVSYSLAAGKSATLVVRLTGAGKGALGKAKGHRLSAKLLASVTGGASVTKPVVLSQAKPKGKHK
jgi:hypothetical protein